MNRKRIRLPREAHDSVGVAWLVTVGVRDRAARPLANEALAGDILCCFERDAPAYGAGLYLAVVMPDHVPLILEPAGRNLIDLMRDHKTRTTRIAWRHGFAGAFWQKSFHDRGLRGSDVHQGVSYVLDNPVRAGLALHWEDYPFIAGLAINE